MRSQEKVLYAKGLACPDRAAHTETEDGNIFVFVYRNFSQRPLIFHVVSTTEMLYMACIVQFYAVI